MIDTIEIALVTSGIFFMVVAGIGVLRLGDFFLRIHAPTKAATLGLISLLAATAIAVRAEVLVTKAILAFLFIAATAPVGAHILSRAAYRTGAGKPRGPRVDEYRARADEHPHSDAPSIEE